MHNWWNYIRKLKCIFVTREFKYSWNSQVYWALLIGLTVEYVSKSKAALPSDHQILNYIVKLVDTVVDQGTLHCITLRFDSHSSHSWSMAGTGNGEKSLRGSGLTVPQNCIIIAKIIIIVCFISDIRFVAYDNHCSKDMEFTFYLCKHSCNCVRRKWSWSTPY